MQRLLESVSATRLVNLNESYESNSKKGNAYKSSQLAGVFLGVTETIHTYILYCYLPKGAFGTMIILLLRKIVLRD